MFDAVLVFASRMTQSNHKRHSALKEGSGYKVESLALKQQRLQKSQGPDTSAR